MSDTNITDSWNNKPDDKSATAADQQEQSGQKKFVSAIIEYLKAGIANIGTLKVSGDLTVGGNISGGSVTAPAWKPYPAGSYVFPSGTQTVAAGVLPIGAVTTAPTFGTGTTKTGYYKDWGKTIDIYPQVIQPTGTVAAAGSGLYLIPMPLGKQIDVTIAPIGSIGTAYSIGSIPVFGIITASYAGVAQLYVYSSTMLAAYINYSASDGTANARDWGSSGTFTPNAFSIIKVGGIITGIPVQ